MAQVSERVVVNAGVEDTARLVADPGRLAEWHPAVASSETEGSVRHLSLTDGRTIEEQITSRDAHSYSYAIEQNPMPLDDYSSVLSVEAEGDGSAITWTGRFRPRGISEDEANELVKGLYRSGLDAIGDHLK